MIYWPPLRASDTRPVVMFRDGSGEIPLVLSNAPAGLGVTVLLRVLITREVFGFDSRASHDEKDKEGVDKARRYGML